MGLSEKSGTSTVAWLRCVWHITFFGPTAVCVAVSLLIELPQQGYQNVIAKSDLVILAVSSSLLAVAVYRWDQNTRNVDTSTVLANTRVEQTAPAVTSAATLNTETPLTAQVTAQVTEQVVEVQEAPIVATIAVEPSEIAEPETQLLTHVVRSGDSLSEIAAQYDTSVGELRRINGISGSTIFIGQEILYPSN